jgi:ceramide glucosyltransferase
MVNSQLVRLLLCTVGLAALAYGLLALLLLLVFQRRTRERPEAPSSFPPVTLLKPLRGQEPGLLENLESFCRQDYPAPVEIVFGVASPEDQALETVAELRRRHPEVPMRVSTEAQPLGMNPKVNNLAGMLPLASHPVLVLSDADIAVPRDYLRRVVAPLAERGVGATTTLYRSRVALPTLWSQILAAYVNGWFLPSVLVGLIGRRSAYGLGATIALKAETLARVGGLVPIADDLADDFRLARLLERQGLAVRLVPTVVTTTVAEPTLASFLAHQIRWARTTRVSRPWGYAFSFLTFPIALALLTLVVTGVRLPSLLLLTAALATRTALFFVASAGQHLAGPLPWALLIPLTELVAFTIWALAFTGRRIEWQGIRYHVNGRGRLRSSDHALGRVHEKGGARARSR